MNLQHVNRYAQMPAQVIQSEEDLRQINYTDYYEIRWDGPNSDFGSFRASPLKGNVAQGKRQVMNILKAAYSTFPPRSFEETVALAKIMEVRIIHIHIYQGSAPNDYTWLS